MHVTIFWVILCIELRYTTMQCKCIEQRLTFYANPKKLNNESQLITRHCSVFYSGGITCVPRAWRIDPRPLSAGRRLLLP